MRKLFLLLMGAVFFASQAMSQRTITGKVTGDKDVPIGNVTVMVKKSKTGTVTKADGTYSLTVPATAKSLVFSSVSFEKLEVAIGAGSIVNASLKVSASSLEDVTVTVGYTTRRKRDEAGAITTIKGSDINDMALPSIDKALQGAAAGVTVQANNGIPGGDIRVNIRGLSSFGSGTAPLWVIDGVPFPTGGSGNISYFTQTNPLAFLNQSDIETIDILKDAASTAIYGASGANGVIIVTTKKGRNAKTKIGFNYYTGFNQPIKLMDVANTQDFLAYKMEAINNQQRLSNINLTPQGLKSAALISMEANLLTGLTTAQINAMTLPQLDSLGNALPTVNWQNEVFRTGRINNFELTLNGGNDKTQFYTSASYQTNKSIVDPVDFKRGNIKIDVTNNINNKLKVNFNAFLSTIYQNAPFATAGSNLGNPAFAAAAILPHNPVRGADGNYFGLYPGKLMGILSNNVIATSDYNVGYERTNEALANVSLDYKLRPWLNFVSSGGIDYRISQGRFFLDPRTPDGGPIQGLGSTHADWFANIITTQKLIFQKSFNNIHNIDGVVGFEFITRKQEGFLAQKTGYPSYQLPLLAAGAVVTQVSESMSENKKNSLFSNINYNYKRKYSVGIVARRDGSSRFGENSKFGFFYAAKAVWNVDRESFFNVKGISMLRVRGSYGQAGNDNIGDYDALGTYTSGPVYNNQSSIFPNRLASSKLTWEDVYETNFGLDMGFLKERLVVSIDVYNKQTKNILQNTALPVYTGWTSVRSNTGKVENKGIEVDVKARVLESSKPGGLKWNVNFNFARNNNKILEILRGTSTLDRNTSILLGKPIGQILTTRFAGINSATGREMYYDSLGNITYRPQLKDRYYAGVGGGLPPISGGFSSTLSYRGVSVDVQFSYQYGQLLSDGQYNFLMETFARVNTLQENIINRWTTPGQITHVPRANPIAEPNGVPHGSGDRFLQKTDFIRMRSITLAYDFGSTFLNRLKLSAARFYVQGGNLFTYTAFKGYDPEFVNTATGIVPQGKNITAGVQFVF
jgi:TonB-dependent starch-binding outer membrane protein SusC